MVTENLVHKLQFYIYVIAMNEQYKGNIWASWLLNQDIIRLKKKNVLPKSFPHAMVLSQASNDYLLIIFLHSILSVRRNFPWGDAI